MTAKLDGAALVAEHRAWRDAGVATISCCGPAVAVDFDDMAGRACTGGDSHGTDCPSAGKRANLLYTDRAPDADAVERELAIGASNMALLLNGNYVVVEADSAEGEAAIIAACGGEPPVTVTRERRTGRGRGYLFYHEGAPLAKNLGALPGVDFLGRQSLFVVPPSIHKSGEPLRWVKGRGPNEVEIDDLPEALLALASVPPPKSTATGEPRPYSGVDSPTAAKTRARLLEAIVNAPDGQRHEARRNGAFFLGRYCGAGALDPASTEAALVAAVLSNTDSPGLAESETRRSFADGVGKPADRGALDLADKFMGGGAPPPPNDSPPPSSVPYGVDYADFLGDDDASDEPDWIVEGLIGAEEPGFIAGDPKAMKTWLTFVLAICIATGQPFLGRFKVKRGRVLVMPLEDHPRRVRRRLRAIARGLGVKKEDLRGWLRVADWSHHFDFGDTAAVMRLSGAIDKWKPSVVFVDSWSRVAAGNENSREDMQPAANAWLALCQAHKVTIGIVHHSPKNADGKNSKLRGSSALRAAMRWALYLDKRGKSKIAVETDGNEDGADDFTIEVVDEVALIPNTMPPRFQKRIKFVVAAQHASPLAALEEKIVEAVTKAGVAGTSKRGVWNAVGGNTAKCFAALDVIEESRRIVNIGTRAKPRYIIPRGEVKS